MSIPPIGLGPIPQLQNPATNEPTEIKRYYYKNPNVCSRGREEYIRFYEEDSQIKGDTYSKLRNEVIENDIDIYVTNEEGKTQKLKDLNLHVAKAILRYINQNTSDIEITCIRSNGSISAVTFI